MKFLIIFFLSIKFLRRQVDEEINFLNHLVQDFSFSFYKKYKIKKKINKSKQNTIAINHERKHNTILTFTLHDTEYLHTLRDQSQMYHFDRLTDQ